MNPLRIPKAWKALLAMEEIGDAPKANGVAVDDPNPYRNDCREVSAEVVKGVTVVAVLCSGSLNYHDDGQLLYWLDWRVIRRGKLVLDGVDEPDMEIPDNPLEICSPELADDAESDDAILFEIEIV